MWHTNNGHTLYTALVIVTQRSILRRCEPRNFYSTRYKFANVLIIIIINNIT